MNQSTCRGDRKYHKLRQRSTRQSTHALGFDGGVEEVNVSEDGGPTIRRQMDTRLPLDLRRELEHYTTGAWFRARTNAYFVYLEDLLLVEPGKPESRIPSLTLLRSTIQNDFHGEIGFVVEEPDRILTHAPASRKIVIMNREVTIAYSSVIHEIFCCKLKAL